MEIAQSTEIRTDVQAETTWRQLAKAVSAKDTRKIKSQARSLLQWIKAGGETPWATDFGSPEMRRQIARIICKRLAEHGQLANKNQ